MYITDPQRQAAFLATLELVETLDGGWSKRFVAPDGVEWLLYYPRGAIHGGGPRVLRTLEVPATVAEWVTACFRSENDDVHGLVVDLSGEPETWFEAVATLETNAFDPVKVRAFVTNLGALAGINRRPTLGKNIGSIDADARTFASLAERAGRLAVDRRSASHDPNAPVQRAV